MAAHPRNWIGAPADDGGHRGSFSRPEDEMEVGDADDAPVVGPPTSQHPARPAEGSAASMWLWFGVFGALIAFFAWAHFGS